MTVSSAMEQAKSALEEMLNNDVYLHHNHAEPVTVVATQKSVYSVYRSVLIRSGRKLAVCTAFYSNCNDE